MRSEVIENNAHQLWTSVPYSYFASEDSLTEVFPICNCLIGRVIFAIVDFFTDGYETKKIHDVTLATLQSMQEQLDERDVSHLRFHFNPDDCEEAYPGCPIHGHTYSDLAKMLLKNHPLGEYDDIKEEAARLIAKFDALPLFTQWQPLTKEQIISQAIWSHREIGSPSVRREELAAFQDHIQKNPNNPVTSITGV